MKKFLSIPVLAAVICAVTPMAAVAQAEYPPPVPTASASACFTVDGDVDGRSVSGQVDHGGDIIVAGPAGTADANGRIDFFMDSGRARLGGSQALKDGSFSHTMTMPKSYKPGQHRLHGEIEGCGESGVDLQVLGASFVAAGIDGGGSGVLPRTGITILSFILAALGLVGVGALLQMARNRRIRSGRQSGDAGVPLLDTRHFVPHMSPPSR